MKEDIIVVGAGGHAKVLIDIIEEQGQYHIIGISDLQMGVGKQFAGYPILGGNEVLKFYFNKGVRNAVNGVGGYRDNVNRSKVFKALKEIGFNFPPIIHPSAVISKSITMGEGCVVFPGVSINTAVDVGANVIIATNASIDHDTNVGDHVLISAGVTIGANVFIEEGTLFALGSKVISGVSISRDTVVGAGAVVTKSIKERGVYLGCPARLQK